MKTNPHRPMNPLKSLKRHVSLNPPKKAHVQYPPRLRGSQDGPTDRTAKVSYTLAGSGSRRSIVGAASAASVVRRLNAGGFVGSVLAPFNETVWRIR